MNRTTPNTLHIVQHLAPGGIETIALDFLEFQSNCHVLSLEGTRGANIGSWPRLEKYDSQIWFASKQPGVDGSLPFKIRRLIKKLKIEVVHTHHIGPLLYGTLGARLAGVKSCIHTHHDAWHLRNEKAAKLTRLATRWLRPMCVADADIVASAVISKTQSPVQVVYNGIDTERFRPTNKEVAQAALGLSSGNIWIGTAGRLTRVKGQDLLIEALFSLPLKVNLAIAGDGDYARFLRLLANNLGVSDRVRFLGHCDDMPMFYNALDIYCMPSRNEGFPLAPLEAQACGVPCVMTKVGASIEALCPDTGVSVKSGCRNALHDGIYTLLNRLEEKEVGEPREFVRQGKDTRQMVETYDDLGWSMLHPKGVL